MAEAALRAGKETQPNPQVSFGAWGLRAMALTYLLVLIAAPILIIAFEGLRHGWDIFWNSVSQPVAASAIWLSVWTAALMAVINTVMGTLTAYVLVHYRFPGKRLLDTVIDLPFAIPTLVTGVMLVLLYGPQTIIGGFFQQTFGLRILFAPPGIVLALMFISYPFVIRAVQPVLAKLDLNQEEAAHTLGASGWTTFRRIVLPAILSAMITGGMLSFARALGEFGSLAIVAGNIPLRTQVATVYIYGQVEGGNLPAASAVSLVMLLIALVTTLAADWLMRRRTHA
ncbi:MAG: sulfate ABC transporter permease subunit CysT [Chloroflexi bacterium]|nr:sulfate ABC transporter permease subunit CysT [Chloroflexota bacterium]